MTEREMPISKSVVSSAYKSVFTLFVYSGRSFLNNRNSNGPNIDPCGTPLIIISSSDNRLLIVTLCLRLSKYEEKP